MQSPIDLEYETAVFNKYIRYERLYNHKLDNATVTVDGGGSVIRIDYPNKYDNDIILYNELNQE